MATYYVRTDGNDANDGSANDAANAWASIKKALTTVSIAGGHTINVNTGTYTENSGAGYLTFGRAFAADVTIQPTTGNADVIVTHAGGDYCILHSGTSSHLYWKKIKFQPLPTALYGYLVVSNNTDITDLTFDTCQFLDPGANISLFYTMRGNTGNVTVTMTGCTGTKRTGATAAWWFLANTALGQTLTVTVTNCTLDAGPGDGLVINGGTATVTGNSLHGADVAGTHALQLGTDGATGNTTSGTVSSNTVSARIGGGHCVLLGAGCTALTFTGNTVYGGDYSLVVKKGTGTTVTSNTLGGGGTAGLLLKGSANASVTGNVILGRAGNCIAGYDADPAYVNSGLTLTGNYVIASGAAVVYYWPTAGNGTGNTVDTNTYHLYGSGSLGTVMGTGGVATLTALRAAWVAGGIATGNDGLSTVLPGAAVGPVIGGRVVRRA